MRKYNTEYLQLGFIFIETENEPKSQCIICLEILFNESMKPFKLHHFETKHDTFIGKFFNFFIANLKKS